MACRPPPVDAKGTHNRTEHEDRTHGGKNRAVPKQTDSIPVPKQTDSIPVAKQTDSTREAQQKPNSKQRRESLCLLQGL